MGETRSPEAVSSVRKVVTILFADLAGSTALQERLDAETTRRVMDRIHRLLADAVAAHAGRVVKFTGDGLMAVFGIPVLREDDALRAVRAGAAMQESFASLSTELRRDLGADIGLRVGVNTGEVVVSPDTDDIVGDPVNVAARLEAAAAVGEVLIGVETGRLVRDVISIEAVPALALKGKELPVAAMRLAATEVQTSVVTTAFVGREDDLERLISAFDDATAVGQARLVTVVGSPGLGKSRLASEVAARLSDRATVLEARCTPSGGSSFGPVVDAIRKVLALDEAALDDAVRDAITARCPRLAADTERVAVTVAALLTASPAGSAEQLFWSVRRLFEALAQDRPVVLLVDDVHWAEPALLDLVEHIAEWARGPMLVLALARPELRERRPTLVEAGGPSSAVIVLGALDDSAGRRLALDLLATDELPGGVLARALEAGEGNPLFLRELLRLLVDDGVLRRIDGRWRATVDEGGIELPATIHAALAARIEQLRPAERTLLETASVIGRHFPRGALLALLPEDVAADLDSHLDALRRRELVDAESTWWANDRLYRFHHALIRDAAYRRVLKEVRADLHARYSTWLETVAEVVSEQDEALGWHLEQAHGFRVELGQFYDEETGRLAERASTHLANAARRALDRDDVASAASLLGRTLLLVAVDDPRRRSLMRGLCDALMACGDTEAAAIAVAELAASATTDHEAAVADLFDAQLEGQRSPEALRSVAERTSRAAQVFAANGDDTGVAHSELVHATAMAALGQVAACEAALDRSLAAARRSGDRRRANAVLAIAPLAALWGPSPVARASGRCLDVIRVLRITSWAPQVEAHALRAQAVLEALRDRPEASRRMIESARVTFADLGQSLGLLEVEIHAGIVELLAGDPAAAEPHLRQARDGFNELGSRVGAARATAVLARALLELDRLDEAAALADPSVGGDDLKATIGLLGVRAEVLSRRNDVVEAERLARRAVEIASGTDALLDHADARLALSRVLAAAGRTSEASAEAARARDLYEAKGSLVGMRQAGMSPTTAVVDARSDKAAERTAARRRVVPNLATAAFEAWAAAMHVGDSEALEQLQAHGRELPDDFLAPGGPHAIELIATLGARHAVHRIDDRIVCVTQTDAAGLLKEIHPFSRDQLSPAMVRFVELWADDELDGAERVRMLAAREFWRSPNGFGSDWQARNHALDTVVVDHRPAGWGTLHGRAAVAHQATALAALANDFRGELVDVYALTTDVAVTRFDVSGTRDGGVFTRPTVIVQQFGEDGLVTRSDIYAPEQLDEALALVDELTGSAAPSTSAPTPTATTRLMQRFCEAFMTGDPEAIGATFALDAVTEDRRPALGNRIEGREAHVADLMLAVTPDADVRCESVATRGERLALVLVTYLGYDVRVDTLLLRETDESGDHFAWSLVFEPEHLDAAYAELDERAVALGGAQWAGFRVIASWAAAYGTGDVERLRECFVPDAVVVDHRPARFGAATVDEFVDLASELFALAESTALRIIEVTAATTEAAVFRMRTTGRMDGGSFENESWASAVFDAGRLSRLELFPPEGRADAAASLVESVGSGPAPTAATRLMERWREAMVTANAEEIGAIYAHDVVAEDRRPLFQRRVDGRQAAVTAKMVVAEQAGIDVQCEPIATRGDRLMLMRTAYVGGSYRVELLNLFETDATGEHLVRTVAFEPEQEDAAYAELDRRAIEVGGPGVLNTVTVTAAYDSGDVALLRACCHPDAVIVDHRPALFGAHGVEEFLERTTSLLALTTSTKLRIIEIPIATASGAVSRLRTTGLTADGGLFESERWSVGMIHEGRLERLELFSADARAEAEARFWELARGHNGPTPNVAARHLERWCEAITRGDAGLLAALNTSDVVTLDRRRVVGVDLDAQETTLNAQWLADRSNLALHHELLATRGDRLALVRQHYRHPLTEVDTLALHEVTSDGRLVQRGVIFDVDDEDTAYAELDARAIALAGDPLLVPLFDSVSALNQRALDSLPFAPNATLIDHTPGGWGTLTTAEYVGFVRGIYDVADEFRVRVIEIPRLASPTVMFRLRVTGARDGGVFELDYWTVSVQTHGLVTHLEQFAVEDRAAAEACFERLSSSTHAGPAPNAASRHAERFSAAVSSGDAEAISQMFAPSSVVDDRRRLVGIRMSPESSFESARLLAEFEGLTLTSEPIATRGDRFVLLRQRFVHRSRAVVETVTVHEVDESGELLDLAVMFDPEDEDAAWDELDGRALEIEGDVLRPLVGVVADYNAHDLDRFGAWFHADCTFLNHAPAGWGSFTTAEYLTYCQSLFDLTDDARVRPLEVAFAETRGFLTRFRMCGRRDGGYFEQDAWIVTGLRDGRICRHEQFLIEERADAEACFARLESAG